MAYSATTWVNGSSQPLSAANLNKIETELVALDVAVFYDPVTSLPGSPVDKQRALLVDSLTAPTYQWVFQYESGISDANKWICVGGVPVVVEVATSESATAGAYADLATSGPSFTAPRAGSWLIGVAATWTNPTSASFASAAVKLGSAAVADTEAVIMNTYASTAFAAAKTEFKRTLAASDVLKVQYKTNVNGSFSQRRLFVMPLRVA